MSELRPKVHADDLPWPVGRLAAVVLLPEEWEPGATGYVLMLPHRAPGEAKAGRFEVPGKNEADGPEEHAIRRAVEWATERAHNVAGRLHRDEGLDPPTQAPKLEPVPDPSQEPGVEELHRLAVEELRRFLFREGGRDAIEEISDRLGEVDKFGEPTDLPWLKGRLEDVLEPLTITEV